MSNDKKGRKQYMETMFEIGDKVKIRVKDASKLLRTVDFEIIEKI